MFKKRFLYIILYTLYFILLAAPVLAQPDLGLGFGEYTGLVAKDPRATIASIINIVLSVLGIVAVVIVLAGGFMWMTAMGNEEKIKKSKGLLTAGVIGLTIILTAYIIARFVIQELVKATTLY